MMRAMRALTMSVFGVVSLVSGCDEDLPVASSSHEIIQGEVVADDALPTLIGITTNAGSICTGTLVSPTAVLTAAHCVEPNIIKQSIQAAGGTPPAEITYQVSFARDLRAAAGTDFLAVASVEWHEEFLQDTAGLFERPGHWNDIAIIHLAEPLTDRPYGGLATPDVVDALDMNQQQLVAGYGLSNDQDVASAGVLKRGLSGLDERGPWELIAGIGDPQQACRGDSGGPIYADDSDTLQIGVASRINSEELIPTTVPGCDTGLLYTRVDAYLDWITARVSDLGEPGDPGDPGGEGEGGGDDGGCRVASRGHGRAPAGLGLAALLVACAVSLARRRK
jgi:hypothetical protein